MPPGCQSGHKVRNGLTLPGAGGAMYDGVLPSQNIDYRPLLAGIGIKNDKLLLRWNTVELPWVEVLLCRSDCVSCFIVTSDRGDKVVRGHFVVSFLEVLHHCHLLKSKIPKDRSLLHRESLYSGSSFSQFGINWFEIELFTHIILRELRHQMIWFNTDAELLFKHMKKNKIHLQSPVPPDSKGVCSLCL